MCTSDVTKSGPEPNVGSWPLLVKRVPHRMLPLRSGGERHLSHLALNPATTRLTVCRGDTRPVPRQRHRDAHPYSGFHSDVGHM